MATSHPFGTEDRDADRVNNECLDGCQMPDHETEVEELESRSNFASRSPERPRPTMNEDLTREPRALNVEQTGSEQQQTEIDRLRDVVHELTSSCEEKQTEIDVLRGLVNELIKRLFPTRANGN
ncbi:PREDICTED: uncharacterized protein LOC107332284 [Acropora digitifera]|uniref:uncharacterized protein LOC107332284 n=1 Tax=Acropora digitifera TaxID=70779 RepID=UPI00077AA4F2|nr:PREDICTED: uncharacterized protein LOC107332284 [Acropora digitifera]